jgi:hypothetical protein
MLDAKIATASKRRRDRNVPILHLTGSMVLGQRGRPDDDGSFGYSLGQCERMRMVILDAAAADARAQSQTGQPAQTRPPGGRHARTT